MSKVCAGLRGDAFVVAQEAGFDNLCEIIDGRPCGVEALVSHMRETVFPSTEYEPERLFCQHCRSEGLSSRKNGENTPFFRTSVSVRESPIGVAFGILWNGGVVRVHVATLKGVACGISRTITKRLDLTFGSSLGFRLRPHNRRDLNPVAIAKPGTKKKCVPLRLFGRAEYGTVCLAATT